MLHHMIMARLLVRPVICGQFIIRFKRAALFARSFQDVLENCTDATAAYKDIAVDSGLR
jgi:hypothetical protein